MNTQMSPDFEQLSAYVDNQLSPAEKAALEARLAKEPELEATLSDLRRTVSAVRSLPTVKPPRSFTLTPQQVGARARRGPLFPIYRLAAALCTLLLAFAVARDLTISSLGASATPDMITQSGAGTPLAAPKAAVLDTPTAESSQEAYGGASALLPTATGSADLAVTPVAHFAPAGTDATPTAGAQRFTATAAATIKNVAPSETPADTAVSVAALPPSATASPTQNPAPPSAPAPTDLRVVEVVLAVLALAAAAAAWLTRRG
jgi:hypothetical protein